MRKSLATSKLAKSNLIKTLSSPNRFASVAAPTGNNNLQAINITSVRDKRMLSSRSRQSTMISNLELGLEYTNKQYDHLVKINDYINQIISIYYKGRLNFDNGWSIYLESIAGLSEERFSNFPLFGDGTEPPIRVHLIQDGVALTHEFPISQLLNCLSFKSLLHSGNSLQPPSEDLLNSSAQEVMQQMLITDRRTINTEKILEKLKYKSVVKKQLLFGQPAQSQKEPCRNRESSLNLLNHFFRKLGRA